MPRRPRTATANVVFHVLNRAVRKMTLFQSAQDYSALETVLVEAVKRFPAIRLLSYVIMPNHWHLVVWPADDAVLSASVGWLTLTHTQRWHAAHGTVGTGPVYQGRFKSFPVQEDQHFYALCRYCERNPKRANLVKRAEHWRWSSLWHRSREGGVLPEWLSQWPIGCPTDWPAIVNRPQTRSELDAIHTSIRRGTPLGTESWMNRTVKRMNLESSLRPRGRPALPK